MSSTKNTPTGFEKKPESAANVFEMNKPKPGAPTAVNFRGRPGMGPGGRMAQTVEHAENANGTLKRLLQYFKKTKK